MGDLFVFNPRLGIEVPSLHREFAEYERGERLRILERWETIRGSIPERIERFETEIALLQQRLHTEEDWDQTILIMDEISDYASRIADLNILFRSQPDADPLEGGSEEHRAREK